MTDTLSAVPDPQEDDQGAADGELPPYTPLIRTAILVGLAGIGCLLAGAAMARLLDGPVDDEDDQGADNGSGAAA